MVLRNHPRGRLAFDRDAIVRAALRAYVEWLLDAFPNGPAYSVCSYAFWTGDVHQGALRTDSGCGDYEVVAWTEAGVVGLAYVKGFGPIANLGLTPDTVTGGPEDVRPAVPGLPAELEPAFQLAAGMLDTFSDVYEGKLPNKRMYSERLAGVGFWLHGDRVAGSMFDDPTLLGVKRLVPWGMLQNGRLPFSLLGELAAKAAERARTRDAPIHAIIDAVVDRRMQGPTEFTTDELATLLAKPPDPKQRLAIQRRLQQVGITWPGSPELPPEELPPGPRINPFTGTPMPEPKRPDK
jgi:hypothetical protein